MRAAIYDITIEQGATFNLPVTYKPGGVVADLTGYTARMQIRKSIQGDVVVTPTIAITDAAAGKITVSMTDAETSAIVVSGETAMQCVYDLELVSADTVVKLLRGRCWVTPEVTKL